MNPVLFDFGFFEIRWYSFIILIAILIAYLLINSESKRFYIKKDFIFNMVFWCIIIGILCARIYYVLFNLNYYSSNIKEIFMIWHGGLAIHGGIIGGALVILFFCRKYKVNTMKIFDIFAPAVIIAQAIGRWGNFFNSEAYGSIVSYQSLVKLKIIPQFVIDNMYIDGNYHLPMFYFESLACLIGFIILLIYRRRKYTKNGQVFGLYLIIYGILRFIIEKFRTDSLMLLNFKVAQIVSILMILFGIYIIFNQKRKPKLDDLYNSYEEEINY